MVAVQSRRSLGDFLINLRHTIDELEIEFARASADFATSSQWDDEGFNTPADWIRFNCRMTSQAVWNGLAVGEQLGSLPQTATALDAGEIGFAHVAVMARTAEAVGKAFDESKLIELAREHSPGKFYFKCLHYRHSVDARAYRKEEEDKFEGRALRLSTAQDGCLLLSGILDPVGGATVRAALEPLARPGGAYDDRSPEQRNADAIVEALSGGRPAQLQITASVETVKAMAGAAAGETELTLPISSGAVQRLACDCNVTRVLLSQESLVMDVGRSRRVISPTLRTALSVRDRHCQWPGCERAASYCDGHHVVHWIHGGSTELGNLILLCRRHHRLVHEGGWQLIRGDDGQVVTIAPTVTFGFPPHSWGGAGAAGGGAGPD